MSDRVIDLFEEHQAVNEENNIKQDEDKLMDIGSNSQSLQATNSFDNVYTRDVASSKKLGICKKIIKNNV